jgi:hypothetical protein
MRNHLTWFVLLLLLLPTTTAAAQGWYLMLPPITPAKNALLAPQVETRAPLSEWRQDETFESVEECQMYRDEWFDVKRHLADYWLKNEPTAHAEAYKFNLWRGEVHDGQAAMVAYGSGLCIASNDPRLAPLR